MTRRNSHFALAVIARDKKCQVCGITENLHAHHIIPISVGGLDIPENGEALCPNCHADKHLDVPRGFFLTSVSKRASDRGKNATVLAAELSCCVDTVVRTAHKCGFQRHGSRWSFSPLQCEIISNYGKRPKADCSVDNRQKKSLPAFVGIAEAAEYLGLAVVTIKYHIYQAGNLSPRKIGKTLIFTREQLDEFNATRRRPGRPHVGEMLPD